MKFTFATVLLFVAAALCETVGPDAMVNLREDKPNTPQGLTHRGKVIGGTNGHHVITLMSFKVPNGGGKCELRFSKPIIANGSKTIALFDFAPTNGVSFDPDKACWNFRTGYRDIPRSIFVVGTSPNPVYKFHCPPTGSIINFEAAPSNGYTDVEWFWFPSGRHGGFTLTAHN